MCFFGGADKRGVGRVLRQMIQCLECMDEAGAKKFLGLEGAKCSPYQDTIVKMAMENHKKRFSSCLKNGSGAFGIEPYSHSG